LIFTLLLKIFLITSLFLILYQDFKERAVWWFLFPVFGIVAGLLHLNESLSFLFFKSLLFNLTAIGIILVISFFYTRFKMKINFLKEAMGLGDIIFFLALTLAFPTNTFIVLFVFSLIFSLMLHLVISRKQKDTTIPLAGYASLFLICIYLSSWLGFYNNLYSIG
jgi:chromate transport protein ChrA